MSLFKIGIQRISYLVIFTILVSPIAMADPTLSHWQLRVFMALFNSAAILVGIVIFNYKGMLKIPENTRHIYKLLYMGFLPSYLLLSLIASVGEQQLIIATGLLPLASLAAAELWWKEKKSKDSPESE